MSSHIQVTIACDVCGKDGAAAEANTPEKHLAANMARLAREQLQEEGWAIGRYQRGGPWIDVCPTCRLIAPHPTLCDNDGDDIEGLTP